MFSGNLNKPNGKKGTRGGAPSPYRRSYATIETLIAPSMKVLEKWSALARPRRPARSRMDAPAQAAAFHSS